ncbi:MAG: hypothetical protein AB4426_24560 [Xenococcaceae cyanobacterium]
MAYAQSLFLIGEVWVQALHPYKPLTPISITTNSGAIALQSSTNAKSDRPLIPISITTSSGTNHSLTLH